MLVILCKKGTFINYKIFIFFMIKGFVTWEMILFAVGLVFLVVASYNDIKKREVPDWLSYGLIFSGLGLRLVFSFEYGWMIFLNGLFGFLVCLGIAYLFYFTNQWGGGDSKILMGMGAVIGFGWGENFGFLGAGESGILSTALSGFDFSLFWFFLSLLVFGGMMGLLWSLVLAVRNWGKFAKEFRSLLSSARKRHFFVLSISFSFLVLSLFYWYFWPLVIFSIGSFYLLCFVKSVEGSCFVKELKEERLSELVEGDWLAKDVVIKGKKVVSKGNGLEKKEIRKLMSLWGEGKLKKVLVKEGIPFIPSFLAAYLVVAVGGWGWLWRWFLG